MFRKQKLVFRKNSVQETKISVQETEISVQETKISVQETKISVQETEISVQDFGPEISVQDALFPPCLLHKTGHLSDDKTPGRGRFLNTN